MATLAKGAIVVIAALGGIAGAVFSSYWTELNQKMDRAKKAGEEAALVTKVGSEMSVSRVEQDTFLIMEELTKNSRDDELLGRIARDREAVEQLSKLYAGATSPPAIKTAVFLSRLYPLIEAYANAIKMPPGNERLNRLRSAARSWKDVSLDGCGQKSASKFEAYRKNVLGMVAMELTKSPSSGGSRRDYSKARGYFEEALEVDPGFAKAHLNLGLISLYAWDTRTATDVGLLDEARRNYSLARKYAVSPMMRSIAYNNMADAYLKESDWHLNKGARSDSEAALRQAERNLAFTFAQAEVKATAYVTRAEALCLDAAVRTKWAKASLDAKEGRAEEVKNSLRVALDLGYTGLLAKKQSQLKTTHPLLGRCLTLDEEFMASIANVVSD